MKAQALKYPSNTYKVMINLNNHVSLDVQTYVRPDTVYCPMCEIIHENNSNCQRND